MLVEQLPINRDAERNIWEHLCLAGASLAIIVLVGACASAMPRELALDSQA